MSKRRTYKKESIIIYLFLMITFFIFLILPLIQLLGISFFSEGSFSLKNYVEILKDNSVIRAGVNSIKISSLSALISTLLAFILAYSIHYTRINHNIKQYIEWFIMLPMFLPTITYGFAIIYSLGRNGILRALIPFEFQSIYGFNGLLIGYIIYSLPFAFLMINNGFKYVDQKFIIVSKLMKDSSMRTFMNTILRPAMASIASGYIVSFIICFTDFGIPASIGGRYDVIASKLYQVMLGTIPNFSGGAVIAIIMLIPAVVGVILLKIFEKYNYEYASITKIEMSENKIRDYILGLFSISIISIIALIFAVVFIVPFMKNYPFNIEFTLNNFYLLFEDKNMLDVIKNSVMLAIFTSILGTIIAFLAALVNVRSYLPKVIKNTIDGISMITNTTPGMVLGISYLLLFSQTSLKSGFAILVLSNVVHFFTTPYLMAKNTLGKLNKGLEVSAELMGDDWFRIVFRIIIPNMYSTMIDMISYFFIQSMVTISAIIFLVSARTMVITTKIKSLQHFAKFNEIFTLSLVIFFINICLKSISNQLHKKFVI